MNRTAVRTAASAATMLLPLLLGSLTACGGEETGRPAAGSSPSAAASPEAPSPADSSSADGSPADSSPADSSPAGSPSATTPAQASGMLLEHTTVSLRGPAGWTKPVDQGLTRYLYDPSDELNSYVMVMDVPYFRKTPLAVHARRTLDLGAGDRLLEPVELLGQRWFHGLRQDPGSTVDVFGTFHDDAAVVLYISQARSVPQAERQAVVDSVLATLAWTE